MAIVAERLDQYRREGASGQSLLGGAQHVGGVTGRYCYQPRRIETEGGQTRTIGLARLAASHLGPYP